MQADTTEQADLAAQTQGIDEDEVNELMAWHECEGGGYDAEVDALKEYLDVSYLSPEEQVVVLELMLERLRG